MTSFSSHLLRGLCVLLMLMFTGAAYAFELKAQQAIIIDATTGAILYEKEADTLMVPSSMSKIMTIYDVLSRLKEGSLKMTDTFNVSEKAWRTQGSKMFVQVGDNVSVQDLLRGIIVQSGNDACVTVAEGSASSEEAYAEHLTQKAHQLGAKSSTLKNASGLPADGHRMTARDLGLIGLKTIQNFPEYYPMYSEVEFTYNGIKQGNRNPLLYDGIGGDGIKTGHTDEGGYGMVGSVLQNGRRILFVINGCSSMKERAQDARLAVNYALRDFHNIQLAPKGATLGKIEVHNGKKRFIPISVSQDCVVTVPAKDKDKITLQLDLPKYTDAPVPAGQKVGTANALLDGKILGTWPVITAEAVEELGFFAKIWQRLMRMIIG